MFDLIDVLLYFLSAYSAFFVCTSSNDGVRETHAVAAKLAEGLRHLHIC